MSDPTETRLERGLRTALDDEARRIDVAPDALTRISSRTRRRHRIWFPKGGLMATLSTGTAVLAATTVLAFASVTGGCGSKPGTTHPPAGTPTTTSTTTTTTTSAPSAPAAISVNVPIYYVGLNSRLYREYHHVPAVSTTPAAELDAAISEMLSGRPLDPDYHSGWPAGVTVRSVKISGGVASVDLHGALTNGGSAAANKAAIEQMVWTATAYSGGTGVRLLFDGAPRATIWATKQPVAGVLHRAAAVDVLSPLWVIDPQQGATSGTKVTVRVAGIAFEAQMVVEITNGRGTVVMHRGVHLSTGAPAQGTATFTVTLDPGTYTITALISGFKGVNTTPIDNHTFTVS